MEEFDKIMQKAAEILDRVAGVTDSMGNVLASTSLSRVGSEDKLAKELFDSEDMVAVTGKATYRKFGIDGQAEYVCFIDGTDNISQTYLELLVNWLTSAIQDGDHEAEKESLLKNILLENELPGDIPLKSREFRIPYAALRVVFLVRVHEEDNLNCIEIMRELFPNRKVDYVLAMDEENVVLVKELHRDEMDSVDEIATTILDTLNSESMAKVHIGIGMPAETLKDCAKSYREANLALTVGSIFEPESYIMRYDRLGLGRLIYQLPSTLCHMFLDEVFPEGSYEQLDSETLLTINKFFENNLNGSETSRQLFVHRNTLVYRLDKVEKITGLDLRTFEDAVMFKLASMVRQYLETMDRESLTIGSSKWWRN